MINTNWRRKFQAGGAMEGGDQEFVQWLVQVLGVQSEEEAQQAIQQLGEEELQALQQAYQQGMSPEEVQQAMGQQTPAMKMGGVLKYYNYLRDNF